MTNSLSVKSNDSLILVRLIIVLSIGTNAFIGSFGVIIVSVIMVALFFCWCCRLRVG